MKIPKHPATVIRRDYVEANGLNYQDIQNCTGISGGHLADVFKNKKYFNTLDAIRLARFFGKPDNSFVLLQARHQAAWASRSSKSAMKIKQVRPLSELKAAIQKERAKVIRRTTLSTKETVV